MNLPRLGVGLVGLPGLEDVVEQVAHFCDVVEVEPQPYFATAPAAEADAFVSRVNTEALDRIRRLGLPTLVHSVGYPIGGSGPGDPTNLALLDAVLSALSPPWWSEHLNFISAEHGGERRNLGFLMPPVQSQKSVDICVDNIKRLQDRFGLPFAFETGTNYLRPDPREIADGLFWGEIADRADAGILLDLHNVWTNARNGRQPVEAVLDDLPLERIWEVHIAAGQKRNGYWVDSHSGLPSAELLALLSRATPRLPNLSAIVLEILPAYFVANEIRPQELALALAAMRESYPERPDDARSAPENRGDGSRPAMDADALPEPREWEKALLSALLGEDARASVGDDPGIQIYRELVEATRKGALSDMVPWTLRYIWNVHGESFLDSVFREFFHAHGPEMHPVKEARRFSSFVQVRLELPFLSDIIELELAQYRSRLSDRPQSVRLRCDPQRLLEFVAEPASSPAPDLDPRDVEIPATPFTKSDGLLRC